MTPARREKLQQFARREQVPAPKAHRLFLSVLRLPRSGRRRRPQATRMLATPSFENDPSAFVKTIWLASRTHLNHGDKLATRSRSWAGEGTYMNTRPMNSVVDKSTKSTDSSPYMFTNWHAQSRSGVCQFIGSRSSFYRMPRELSLCPRWSPMTGLLHIRDLQRQRRSRRSLRCKTCKSFGRRGHKSSRTR